MPEAHDRVEVAAQQPTPLRDAGGPRLGLLSAASMASVSSRSIAPFIALSRSGRFKVTSATAPRVS
jgi:hypothetical protein